MLLAKDFPPVSHYSDLHVAYVAKLSVSLNKMLVKVGVISFRRSRAGAFHVKRIGETPQ